MSSFFKASAFGVALAILGFAGPSQAAALYWSRVNVASSSETICLLFARDVARNALTNVRFTRGLEVAGTRGPSYAAITCVGRGSNARAMAVIMVLSDQAASAINLRDHLADRIQRVRQID